MIIVKDNFFSSDVSTLIERGSEAYPWSYYHKSDMGDPTHNKFFVSTLWDKSSDINFFYLLSKVIQKDVSYLSDCCCWRIIANGQVNGQNANWHTDHGDKTALYFPLTWSQDWGGSTYFKTEHAETEVKYLQNRLVIFDSNIFHYGSCPHVDNILRISIAFNWRKM
ncbi:hypothetical protein IYY11_00995 [Methylocystis sp. H62]|uniref:hypothetical protein n=1 Tax=Methylocystis sp. H62 TaxID=2785789 RepID=UPI0018C26B26|nr:hypothetical protein [Methylocystis sp. H62]MBG0792065.1 hypothetical protein [Methylocystis sp. H62]